MDVDLNKYENSLLKGLDKENINKIATFLLSKNCDFLDELFEDYLDIFSIDYDLFVSKFNKLDELYNHHLIDEIRDDMEIMEEFY